MTCEMFAPDVAGLCNRIASWEWVRKENGKRVLFCDECHLSCMASRDIDFSVNWTWSKVGSAVAATPAAKLCTCPLSALMMSGCKCGGD